MFKSSGSEGHLRLVLKYKATLKPEDAEGSKGRQRQEQLPEQHICKLSMLDLRRPTALTVKRVRVDLGVEKENLGLEQRRREVPQSGQFRLHVSRPISTI